MQRQKISLFWRNHVLKQLKENKNTHLIISYLALIILGVLFLLPKNGYLSQVDAPSLIKLTNEQRMQAGLPALTYNDQLTLAAENKARALLDGGYFSHSSPDGKDFSEWVIEAGYKYAYTGENLAMDFMTNEGVVTGWMNSGKHRENILNSNYEEIGMVAVNGIFQGRRTVVVVQVFGTELDDYLASQEKKYLAVDNSFLLPRFLSYNTFDIFIPKTKEETIVRHNNTNKILVLNGGHLKVYNDLNDAYWGEVDGREFLHKTIKIKLLGKNNQSLDVYPR